MDVAIRYRDRVREETLLPRVNWRNTRNPSSYTGNGIGLAEPTDKELVPAHNARRGA